MPEDIFYADATELAQRIRDRVLSPVEVVQAHLDRIEAVNPKLNALIAYPERVLEQAREAEAAIGRGENRGPLHGVPFTVKDCVDTQGVRTTRGSKLFEDRVPTADATVVKRLKDAGGIFIAKTNMPEFALWWETDNLVYGRTENPWKAGRTPGGSSGGEASAIASGMSPIGIGSDVGGSIREPANYCGIVGLKATHGRIPLTGHWPEALLRFMHVGPLARSVRDAALGLSLMAGPDGLDYYAMPVPIPDVSDLGAPAGLRVARSVPWTPRSRARWPGRRLPWRS
jgi:aspartyl-tRNA(Asn)/glutamyl-tRNA(Gln) amidotransferase subunit A